MTIRGYYKIRDGRNQELNVSRTVTGTDSISLAEAKTHCRVDFTDEDSYISTLIAAARRAIENYIACSLVATTVTVLMEYGGNDYELPFGPYVSGIVVKDSDGNTISADDYKLKGEEFKLFDYDGCGEISLSYTAGYTSETLPPDLKLAILHQIAWLYENRSDGGIAPTAKTLAAQYSRKSWIL